MYERLRRNTGSHAAFAGMAEFERALIHERTSAGRDRRRRSEACASGDRRQWRSAARAGALRAISLAMSTLAAPATSGCWRRKGSLGSPSARFGSGPAGLQGGGPLGCAGDRLLAAPAACSQVSAQPPRNGRQYRSGMAEKLCPADVSSRRGRTLQGTAPRAPCRHLCIPAEEFS